MAESDTQIIPNSPVAAAVAAVEEIPASTAKKAASAVAKPKVNKSTTTSQPSHPPIQQMVDASIRNLKKRNGSSLPAIKKYISATYKCDAQKLARFIKKYLKSALASEKLIQTKGKGASGSFKFSPAVAKNIRPDGAKEGKKVKSTTGCETKKSADASLTETRCSRAKSFQDRYKKHYTPKERAEMVQLYIENGFSTRSTLSAFRKKYKGKTAPATVTIMSLYEKFMNTGNLSNSIRS